MHGALLLLGIGWLRYVPSGQEDDFGFGGDSRRKYGVDIEFRIQEDGGALKVFLKQARLLGAVWPE